MCAGTCTRECLLVGGGWGGGALQLPLSFESARWSTTGVFSSSVDKKKSHLIRHLVSNKNFLIQKIKIWFDDSDDVKSCGQEWSSFQPLALKF